MPLTITSATAQLNTRLKFCQAGTSPAFTNQELSDFIDLAVLDYANYRPLKTTESFSIVAGQQDYDWPTDANSVQPFLFSDTEQPQPLYWYGNPTDTFWLTNYFQHFFESPGLQARNFAYLTRFYKQCQRRLEVDEVNRKLTIYPIPDTDQSVIIPIIKAYAKTGTIPDDQYADIPNEHVRYVLNLAEAMALRSIAKGYAISNKKIGDRDVRGKDMANHMQEEAARLEQDFADYFAQAVVARS